MTWPQWETQWRQVQAEWRGNMRLRGATWLILLIGLVYFWKLSDQFVAGLDEGLAESARRYSQVRRIVNQAEWGERARLAEVYEQGISVRLWRADSLGQAQASFQTWLEAQLQDLPIAGLLLQVEAATAVQGKAGYWQVPAQLRGEFKPEQFHRLLALLEGHERMVSVDRLEISPSQGDKMAFVLVLKAWFARPAEATPK